MPWIGHRSMPGWCGLHQGLTQVGESSGQVGRPLSLSAWNQTGDLRERGLILLPKHKTPTESSCRQRRPDRSSSASRGCVHVHLPAYRWVNFGSFAKTCHGKSFYSGFLLFLEQQGENEYYSLTINQERTTLPSTTSDRQRARVKRKNVCKSKAWRDGANLKAHIASRAFPREIPVRGHFFERRFQPLSVGAFFSNQRESISRCPKSPFPSKTQNRQIARTSPLMNVGFVSIIQKIVLNPKGAFHRTLDRPHTE